MSEKKMNMIVCGGWNSKIGPGALSDILKDLPKKEDKNLIVGYESSDDAAVYKITDDKAIIQTLDFFTTMINDPYLYGQIAATNALSDGWRSYFCFKYCSFSWKYGFRNFTSNT